MGWLDRLEGWSWRRLERKAQGFGKGNAFAMLVSYYALQDANKTRAKDAAWLAREVLVLRPGWQRVNESQFQYTKTGEVVEVPDDSSIHEVIPTVVAIEIDDFLVGRRHDERQRIRLMHLAMEAASDRVRRQLG